MVNVRELNQVMCQYFWDRRDDDNEWTWLCDKLNATDEELRLAFRRQGFEEGQ